MSTVLAAVMGFTFITLLLVAALVFARARLVAGGEVQIEINDDPDQTLTTRPGGTLLNVLAQEGIYIPSACGGQGSCGVCKVTVRGGDGTLLPTETSHITRAEARSGVRLSCQVKVKQDMAVEVPAQLLHTQQWKCTVRSNHNVATFIKELVLELPEGQSVPFRAGGYVQVAVPPHELSYDQFDIDERFRETWSQLNMWRYVSKVRQPAERAYSMANYPEERGILMLNVRIASPPPKLPDVPPCIVSSYLFSLKPGDTLTVSGPFGEFYARDTNAEMVFIGGGAGMAPMRSHIFDQLERLHSKRTISFWYGARSLQEAFYEEDFDRLAAEHDNFQWTLALSEPLEEDHWQGATGFIHQVVLERYLRDHPAPEEIEYYLCGPPPMIDACERMLAELGVDRENIMFDKFG